METAVKIEKLKIAFLGTGWIGRSRMMTLANNKYADVSMIADSDTSAAHSAAEAFTGARVAGSYEELLDASPDGIVIATPSALHAEQSIKALERGISVFCQKPLGRNYPETKRVVDAAKKANKLLEVDFSYRYTVFRTVYDLVQTGRLGEIYAVDLIFHNAWGPDKAWFYDPKLSGGGCVIDLGVHLVDLALWTLDFPEITSVSSNLLFKGKPIKDNPEVAEDYATAQFETQTGTSIRLACSWNLPAGKDAVIQATFYGTKGGATFKNVHGSFYDFGVGQFNKTSTTILNSPPDNWGGRAINRWVENLSFSADYTEEADQFCSVVKVIDKIYKR